MRFTGPSAVDALCACLLDARRSAEAQGRLDFTAEVEFAGCPAAMAGAMRARHSASAADFMSLEPPVALKKRS